MPFFAQLVHFQMKSSCSVPHFCLIVTNNFNWPGIDCMITLENTSCQSWFSKITTPATRSVGNKKNREFSFTFHTRNQSKKNKFHKNCPFHVSNWIRILLKMSCCKPKLKFSDLSIVHDFRQRSACKVWSENYRMLSDKWVRPFKALKNPTVSNQCKKINGEPHNFINLLRTAKKRSTLRA